MTAEGGLVGLLCRCSVLLSGLLLVCLLLIRVVGLSRLMSQRVREVYDDRLQFMSRHDAFSSTSIWMLVRSLVRGSSGQVLLRLRLLMHISFVGPIPTRGLVPGECFVPGCQAGHKVRKARSNAADALDAADIFLYRDSSIAPLLDMRRRFKAVMDVLDALFGLNRLRSLLNGLRFLL